MHLTLTTAFRLAIAFCVAGCSLPDDSSEGPVERAVTTAPSRSRSVPGDGATYAIAGVVYAGPIRVTKADSFADGGTMTVDIVDADGREASFCNDGRLSFTDEEERVRREHPLYVGVHPALPGAVELAAVGADVEELDRMLQDWSAATSLRDRPRFPSSWDAFDANIEIRTAEEFAEFVHSYVRDDRAR